MSLDGTVQDVVRLRLDDAWSGAPGERGWDDFSMSQWTPSLTPDRQRVVLFDSDAGEARAWRLADGEEAHRWPFVEDDPHCGVAPYADGLVFHSASGGGLAAFEAGRSALRTVVSPRIGGSCLLWASEALGGRAHNFPVLGTATDSWTWWWRELLLAPLLVGLSGLLIAVRRRRRADPELAASFVAFSGRAGGGVATSPLRDARDDLSTDVPARAAARGLAERRTTWGATGVPVADWPPVRQRWRPRCSRSS